MMTPVFEIFDQIGSLFYANFVPEILGLKSVINLHMLQTRQRPVLWVLTDGASRRHTIKLIGGSPLLLEGASRMAYNKTDRWQPIAVSVSCYVNMHRLDC